MAKPKALAFVPALLSAVEPLVRVVPVPWNFALLIRVPTAILCFVVALAAKPPPRPRAFYFATAGALGFALYFILVPFTLFRDSQTDTYAPGQYVAKGIWVTESARHEMAQKRWTRDTIEHHRSPNDWDSLYDIGSQTVTSAVLLVIYCGAFVSLTYGFKGLVASDDQEG